nr:hypothetical protein [Chitinophagaceae bacterium]
AMHLFVQKHYGKHGVQTGGWLLRLAIYLRSAIAATLLPVAKYHHKNIRPKAIIIAGLPADTGRVGTLLPADILSAATLYPMLPAAALPFLQALKMPRRDVILIWCIGNGFLLKEAVALLPMVKPHAAGIGYHYVGSGSVVGGAGSSSAGFGWGPALH